MNGSITLSQFVEVGAVIFIIIFILQRDWKACLRSYGKEIAEPEFELSQRSYIVQLFSPEVSPIKVNDFLLVLT